MSETRMREALENIVVQTKRTDAYEATKVMAINEIALAALTEPSPSKRGLISEPSEELIQLAREALERMEKSEPEPIETWARRLAEGLCEDAANDPPTLMLKSSPSNTEGEGEVEIPENGTLSGYMEEADVGIVGRAQMYFDPSPSRVPVTVTFRNGRPSAIDYGDVTALASEGEGEKAEPSAPQAEEAVEEK